LGFLHVLFNMLMVYFIGAQLEQQFGSIATLGQALGFSIVTHIIYNATFGLLSALSGDETLRFTCTAGYSGNIFALIWIMIVISGIPSISFCGLFSMPARLYPFFLLLLMSVMGSGVSFMGHLAGLLVGIAYSYGLLNWFSLPRTWLLAFDQSRAGRLLNRVPGYVAVPEGPPALLKEEHVDAAVATTTFEDFTATSPGRVLCMPCLRCCGPRPRSFTGSRGTAGGRDTSGGGAAAGAGAAAAAGAGAGHTAFSGPGFRVGGDEGQSASEGDGGVWGRVTNVFRGRPDGAEPVAGSAPEADLEEGTAPVVGSVNAPRVHRNGYAAFQDDGDDSASELVGNSSQAAQTTAPSQQQASTQPEAPVDRRAPRPGRPVSRLIQ
jgi:hypothetical protein